MAISNAKAPLRILQQGGSIPLLFVTFILPLLFFLLSLSLDISSYYTEQSNTQKVFDDAAMYAYRFLPYRSDATSAATQYLNRMNAMSEGVTVGLESDGIVLKTQRTFTLSFAQMLGLKEAGLPISVVSRVRGTPLDVYLTLDTSSYLAPAVTAGATAWGATGDWPTASYFEQPLFHPATLADRPRLLTQQCFNPSFSALKSAAIQAADFLGAFELNQVGVGYYAGDPNMPLVLGRSVRAFSQLPVPDGQLTESAFVNLGNASVANADCAAVAQSDSSPQQYQFPGRPHGLPSRGDLSGKPLYLVDPGAHQFDDAKQREYGPYLEARQVIWYQAVREPKAGAGGELLQGVASELLAAAALPSRKGLTDRPARVGIVFAGDVPHQNGVVFPDIEASDAVRSALRHSFIEYASTSNDPGKIVLFYVLLQQDSMPDRADAAASLQELFDEERKNAGISTDKFMARVLYVRTPDQLVQSLMQSLVLINRTAVVSM